MNATGYHILSFSYYNKYAPISLSNVSILILTDCSKIKNIKHNTFVNDSFNIRNTYSYKSDQLYNISFLVNSINNTIIREQFLINWRLKFPNLRNLYNFFRFFGYGQSNTFMILDRSILILSLSIRNPRNTIFFL